MGSCATRGDGLCNERSDSWLAVFFPFFTLDNNRHLGIDDGSELVAPKLLKLLWPETLIPLVASTVLWWYVNECVKSNCWLGVEDATRRRRLFNLTTSLIHSCVSSCLLLLFLLRSGRLMWHSPMHYYNYWDGLLVLLSTGYFIYDGVDILTNDDPMSLVSMVMFIHHLGSVYVLGTSIVSKKFLLYAYWALLMEVSSIFIHTRSLLHISKLSAGPLQEFSRLLGYMNVIAYVIFRFGVQFFHIGWAYVNRERMHAVYNWIAFAGGGLFLAINVGIFLRILSSDGLFQEEKHDRPRTANTLN